MYVYLVIITETTVVVYHGLAIFQPEIKLKRSGNLALKYNFYLIFLFIRETIGLSPVTNDGRITTEANIWNPNTTKSFENENSEVLGVMKPATNKPSEIQFQLDSQQMVIINKNTLVARIGKFINSELSGFGIEVNAKEGMQIFAGTWTRGKLSKGIKLFTDTMAVQYIDR